MSILTESWFIRDCLFIALTLGLVLTCLSNTEIAVEEPITYFIAITPVYFFTFWIGACILLTYATVTGARVQGWGFFFFILFIISGALVVDPKDPTSPCIWEREFERVSDQSGGTRFSMEEFFAKANAWARERRPLIFRPPLPECLDLDFPGTKNRHTWWYTKEETDQMIDEWLRKFGLQNDIYRSHILRLLKQSRQILQDMEADWESKPDPAERDKILSWRREAVFKLQEEAVCEWQPNYCGWIGGHGFMPLVEEDEGSEGNNGIEKEEDNEPTTLPTLQPTEEANGEGPEQEQSRAPHTHVPHNEGGHMDTQDALSGLRAETETGSAERDDEQMILEIAREESISESTAETKTRESVRRPTSLSKERFDYSLGFSEREDDDGFSQMFGTQARPESRAVLESDVRLEPEGEKVLASMKKRNKLKKKESGTEKVGSGPLLL